MFLSTGDFSGSCWLSDYGTLNYHSFSFTYECCCLWGLPRTAGTSSWGWSGPPPLGWGSARRPWFPPGVTGLRWGRADKSLHLSQRINVRCVWENGRNQRQYDIWFAWVTNIQNKSSERVNNSLTGKLSIVWQQATAQSLYTHKITYVFSVRPFPVLWSVSKCVRLNLTYRNVYYSTTAI